MPGWIAVVPIPDPDQQEETPTIVPTQFGFGVLKMSQGIESAIVVEKCDDAGGQLVIPFHEDDVVFYPNDRGVEIGDRTFIQLGSIIGYTGKE